MTTYCVDKTGTLLDKSVDKMTTYCVGKTGTVYEPSHVHVF